MRYKSILIWPTKPSDGPAKPIDVIYTIGKKKEHQEQTVHKTHRPRLCCGIQNEPLMRRFSSDAKWLVKVESMFVVAHGTGASFVWCTSQKVHVVKAYNSFNLVRPSSVIVGLSCWPGPLIWPLHGPKQEVRFSRIDTPILARATFQPLGGFSNNIYISKFGNNRGVRIGDWNHGCAPKMISVISYTPTPFISFTQQLTTLL